MAHRLNPQFFLATVNVVEMQKLHPGLASFFFLYNYLLLVCTLLKIFVVVVWFVACVFPFWHPHQHVFLGLFDWLTYLIDQLKKNTVPCFFFFLG